MYLTRNVIVAVLIMALSPLPAYPFLVPYASLTTAEEKDLGDEFMRHLKRRCVFIEDPCIVDYVNKIGQEIVRQHPSTPFSFEFYVVKEDVYNAFASPAGHIVIFSGLLAAMESEEELAGILGHEAAHVFCRHISKRIEQSKKIGLITLAGILTGIFLGGSPEAASAITSSTIAAGQSLALKYSREDERQADQVGLKYLTEAGYSGAGLLRMLKKIREKRWFGSEQIPSYVTTHPAVEERMAYLDTWLQARSEQIVGARPKDSAEFHKVRTKVIALYQDATAARNTFDEQLRKGPAAALGYYGKGLLSAREGKKKEALENLKRAVELWPKDVDILRDLGKTYFQMGDYTKALEALVNALVFDPTDKEARFLVGRSQMETGDLKGALETFKSLHNSNPDYLPGTYYLGETYGKLGNSAEAHYHLGLYYKEKERLANASFHLKRALKLSTEDPVKQEAIEEALKGLQDLPVEETND